MSTTIETTTFTGNLTTKVSQELDQDVDPTTSSIIFTTLDEYVAFPSGTGVLQPFVRFVEDDGNPEYEEAYNYEPGLTGNPTEPLDVMDRQKVIDLTNVAVVTVNGIQFYDFRLDINEPNTDPRNLFTIDRLKFYSSNQADLYNLNQATNTWTDYSTGLTVTPDLIFDLDDSETDRSITLDANLQPGSGKSDMAFFVPVTAFTGRYAYLYTAASDYDPRFEEWSYVIATTTPSASIDVEKYVSIDGGATWEDADAATGPYAYSTATVRFKFVVTNTGNVDLANVTLSDSDFDLNGAADGTDLLIGNLAAADSVAGGGADTQVFFYTATWQPGQHTNTATATGSFLGTTYSDSDDANYFGANPDLTVEKTAEVADGTADAAGDVINYVVTVTNSGNVTLTNVTVDDPLLGGLLTTVASLAPGESIDVAGSYELTQADFDSNGGGDGDIDNTATADSNETDPEQASAAVELVYDPDLTVEKTAEVADGTADTAGDVINYLVTVTNSGNVTLTDVTVDDPLLGGLLTTVASLAPGESIDVAGSYELTQDDLNDRGGGDGMLDNTATADSEETDPESASAAVPLVYDPDLTITKEADLTSVDMVGQVINYTIVVDNAGNVDLTGVDVIDPMLGALSGPAGDDGDGILEVDETWTYTGTYGVTQGVLDAGADLVNVATAYSNETTPEQASATVDVVQLPALEITKDTPILFAEAAGQVIPYYVVVTNTGNITLTNVAVNDPLTGLSAIIDVLAPGASTSFETTYTVAQADIDTNGGGDGAIENTATADSDRTDPVSASESVQILYDPKLVMDKVVLGTDADGNGLLDNPGEIITYQIVVTNTGNVTLTNVVVTDPLTLTDVNLGDLAPGDTTSVMADYAITQEDLDSNGGGDGDIDNTATADSDQTEPASDSEEVPLTLDPRIALDKVTNGMDGPILMKDAPVTWTYTVVNTGNVALAVTLFDDELGFITDVPSGDMDSDGLLDVDETWVYEATGTAVEGFYDNVGSVMGVDAAGTAVYADDPSYYFGANPGIDVEKYVVVDGIAVDADEVTGPYLLDGPLTFQFVVTNTGNVALENVVVTDDVYGGIHNVDSLAVGESVSIGLAGTWQAGQHTNVATATGSFLGVTYSDTDAANYFGAAPDIDIEKYVWDGDNWEDADTATGPYLLDGPVQFMFVVENTGNVDLDDVEVLDSEFGEIGTVLSLAVGQSTTFTYVAPWQAGQHTNTGYAFASFGAALVDDNDAANYFGAAPEIDIEKEVWDGFTWVDADTATGPYLLGGPVSFRFVVTNTGNVALDDVEVTDSDFGWIGTVISLGEGETVEFTYDAAWVAGQHTNTATAVASFGAALVDDSDDANYFGAAPSITVDKKINGSDECLDIPEGTDLTFTFLVTNTGNVDLANLLVEDAQLGFTTSISLAAGASELITITGLEAVTGEWTNTVNVTGMYTDDAGAEAPLFATDTACYVVEDCYDGLTPGFWGSAQNWGKVTFDAGFLTWLTGLGDDLNGNGSVSVAEAIRSVTFAEAFDVASTFTFRQGSKNFTVNTESLTLLKALGMETGFNLFPHATAALLNSGVVSHIDDAEFDYMLETAEVQDLVQDVFGLPGATRADLIARGAAMEELKLDLEDLNQLGVNTCAIEDQLMPMFQANSYALIG